MGWAVKLMKIMVTSLKRPHACTATLSVPNTSAGHHRPMPLPETPWHSQASLGRSLVGSLLLSPGSWSSQSYDQPRQHIKKQRYYFANRGLSSQSYGFSSIHIWMWELDYKESWTLKNWCFWNVVLEKTLESPLDCKEIQPVHPKGNQSWIFIGRIWCWRNCNTLATCCEELTHWKRPWWWGRLKAGGEGDDRVRDGWVASPTQWIWVWASSRSCWWTGKPGML